MNELTNLLSVEKWKKLFNARKQIWVVGYLNSNYEDSLSDLKIAIENGADAIVFEGKDHQKVDEFLAQLRMAAPHFRMGVNFLGPDENLGTYQETFTLAKKHNLEIAWTDFSGVDQIHEMKDLDLNHIESIRSDSFFYVSGVHMKYSTLRDPKKRVEKSALQAMGWVDGIVLTGSKTGAAADLEAVKSVRSQIGDFPMGLASGVTAENVSSFIPWIDFVLVNTGISSENHRISAEKLNRLRKVMGD